MIPKIIHCCWFGGKEIPKEYKKYIATWRKQCPDYKIYCWTEKNYDINRNQFMKDAYDKQKWGFVPDFARLDIIYNYGGIYLDTDVELLKNLDDLLNNQMFVGMENKGYIALGLGFGAEKGHPFIKELRDRYKEMEFLCEGDVVKNLASPSVQTPMFKKKYKVNFRENKTYRFEDCTVYAKEYFCPESFPSGDVEITDNTYSWHHYSASWYSKRDRFALFARRILSKYVDKNLAMSVEGFIRGKKR